MYFFFSLEKLWNTRRSDKTNNARVGGLVWIITLWNDFLSSLQYWTAGSLVMDLSRLIYGCGLTGGGKPRATLGWPVSETRFKPRTCRLRRSIAKNYTEIISRLRVRYLEWIQLSMETAQWFAFLKRAVRILLLSKKRGAFQFLAASQKTNSNKDVF